MSGCNSIFVYPCPKNSGQTVDYQFDWTNHIGTETIVSQTLLVTGVTLIASSIDITNKKVNMRLSGGTTKTVAEITNTIVTNSGQILPKTAKLRIR